MPSKKIAYNETFAYLGGRGSKKIPIILPLIHGHLGMHSKKKIAEKETLVHSHLTPSLPSLNGTREMGT